MDIDYLLRYGDIPEDDEVRNDVMAGLSQDKRSMFYHRGYGAGLKEYEGMPDGLAFNIGVRSSIAAWLAARNLEVSDGSNGTRDRRVATSQGVIELSGGNGERNVAVPYLRYADLNNPQRLVVPV